MAIKIFWDILNLQACHQGGQVCPPTVWLLKVTADNRVLGWISYVTSFLCKGTLIEVTIP